MKTLLVLAAHPELVESVRAALNPDSYRVIHRSDITEAEPLLGRGLFDAGIIDVDQLETEGIWVIEKLRRRMPSMPTLVYSSATPWDLEEEASSTAWRMCFANPCVPGC